MRTLAAIAFALFLGTNLSAQKKPTPPPAIQTQVIKEKEWTYEDKTNTLTIPDQASLKKDPKLGYDITLTMDYYPIKVSENPNEPASRHNIANPNLLPDGATQVLPFLLNGKPFTGKLKGVHNKTQQPVLDITYKDGYSTGMFKAADATGKLHPLRCSLAEAQAEANKRRDAKKPR